ncbi:MAG TPA: hypothetical protein VKG82_07725 [Solirubrobacteraceae bacterium]|nr:hypothetical protein [Solirubrobacteraceae bacterium]HME04499.1 hypothetical protein [Solirubrobacteraceae bacterium]
MSRELERSIERKIRRWILEQEYDRLREGQRHIADKNASTRDEHK